MSNQIKESLAIHLDDFNNNILKSYETLLHQNIKNTFTELFENQKSKIKNDMIENIIYKDMYDYSDINEKCKELFDECEEKNKGFEKQNTQQKELTYRSVPFVCQSIMIPYYYKNIDTEVKETIIIDFIYYKNLPNNTEIHNQYGISDYECILKNKEIIIVKHNFVDNWGNSQLMIMITNFGKVFINGENNWVSGCSNFYDFDIKIPLDYVPILNLQLKIGTGSNTTQITHLFKNIKENLYNRRFLPLFAKDIETEKQQLIKQKEEFKNEYEKFMEDKKQFEYERKEYKDFQYEVEKLITDKRELEIKKKKLISFTLENKNIKNNLERDKKQLDKERTEFEIKKKQTIREIDDDTFEDLLNL